jgi:hypothetical protein
MSNFQGTWLDRACILGLVRNGQCLTQEEIYPQRDITVSYGFNRRWILSPAGCRQCWGDLQCSECSREDLQRGQQNLLGQ